MKILPGFKPYGLPTDYEATSTDVRRWIVDKNPSYRDTACNADIVTNIGFWGSLVSFFYNWWKGNDDLKRNFGFGAIGAFIAGGGVGFLNGTIMGRVDLEMKKKGMDSGPSPKDQTPESTSENNTGGFNRSQFFNEFKVTYVKCSNLIDQNEPIVRVNFQTKQLLRKFGNRAEIYRALTDFITEEPTRLQNEPLLIVCNSVKDSGEVLLKAGKTKSDKEKVAEEIENFSEAIELYKPKSVDS